MAIYKKFNFLPNIKIEGMKERVLYKDNNIIVAFQINEAGVYIPNHEHPFDELIALIKGDYGQLNQDEIRNYNYMRVISAGLEHGGEVKDISEWISIKPTDMKFSEVSGISNGIEIKYIGLDKELTIVSGVLTPTQIKNLSENYGNLEIAIENDKSDINTYYQNTKIFRNNPNQQIALYLK